MTFRELLKVSEITVTANGGRGDPAISDIVYDSRNVRPGALYVAVPGTKVHGDTFIESAIKNGAAAVISENRQTEELSTPWATISDVRVALGKLGLTLWKIDLSGMNGLTTVGVTGTNGKTTTVSLFKNLFDAVYGKDCSWLFGTIGNVLGGESLGASHTTPEAVDIFRLINNAKVKPKSVAMEVSSHALALKRIAGMEFDVAVWTNLTQDHLDFHKSMEGYYAAKKSLFGEYVKPGGRGVINADDEYGKRICSELKSADLLTYGRSVEADVRITGWKCDWGGTSVDIDYQGKKQSFTSPLRGFFNVYNMTAMIAGAFALGVDARIIKEALASTPIVSGRMDIVDIDAPFTVVVDYAHTPDALVNVLKTCKELTPGRLICVFGCGGDRDRTKRPLMAEAVAENCDQAVVTSDNPRSEEPLSIIDDILKGMPQNFQYGVDVDRREAIKQAMLAAKPNDCVVIAGKGHESYQEVKGKRSQFDDKLEAIEAYKKMC